MSNIGLVNELISAINLDRFAEIEARHNPDVVMWSFRGPALHSSVAVQDWHTKFLRDYQDCNYAELEYVEDGDTVCARATIEAKGYDYRPFTQRVVEVMRFAEGGVAERRLYGMMRDLELDKAATAAMNAATAFKGGSASGTKAAVDGFYAAVLAGDTETAAGFLDPKATLIDSVFGIANGPESIFALLQAVPEPAFGTRRVTHSYAGAKDAVVELAVDASRPRSADWVRLVDGKIAVIETYWMLKEIGLTVESGPRLERRAILPI